MLTRHLLASLVLLSAGLITAQPITEEVYRVERLPNAVNTVDYDETGPVISLNGRTLYFTRVDAPENALTYIDKNTRAVSTMTPGQYRRWLRNNYGNDTRGFNQDIYVAESNGYAFSQVSHPGFPLNTMYPNSVCSTLPGQDELIVVNQMNAEGVVSGGFSTVERAPEGSYTMPEPIDIPNLNTTRPGVNLQMTADGRHLLLALHRRDSYGSQDLYVCHLDDSGEWSSPINLGSVVNTRYRETTPCLSRDGRTLYFASNRPEAMGNDPDNKDIFYTERDGDSWTSWSAPKRMDYPINTRSDESNPSFSYVTGHLYFSSRRNSTHDIFRAAVALPRSVLTVRVFDTHRRQFISAPVLRIDVATGDTLRTQVGSMRTDVPSAMGRTYRLVPDLGTRYIVHPRTVTSTGADLYDITLDVNPIEEQVLITIDDLYFEQGLAVLKPESTTALEDLVRILTQYPTLRIQIEGHTDNNGQASALQQLSEDRAESVKTYVVDAGIDGARVTTRGFGGTKPVADNDDPEARALNRRVAFRIIER